MNHKLQGIKVSLNYLIDIVRTGHETHPKAICIDGVPETAKFEYSIVSDINRWIVLVFSDESFPEVEFGKTIPIKDATMMTLEYSMGSISVKQEEKDAS